MGLLAGGLVSGVQLAISASNTGGAWDNAKKYVEKGGLVIDMPKIDEVTGETVRNMDGTPVLVPVRQRKGGECHKAAVVGDTVGDPFKDTSGPALNILMKLMAIISLVFADFFMSINNGQGYFNVPRQTFEERVAVWRCIRETRITQREETIENDTKTIPRVFTSVSPPSRLVSYGPLGATERARQIRALARSSRLLSPPPPPVTRSLRRRRTLDDAPLPSSPPEVSTVRNSRDSDGWRASPSLARAIASIMIPVAPAFAPGDGDVRSARTPPLFRSPDAAEDRDRDSPRGPAGRCRGARRRRRPRHRHFVRARLRRRGRRARREDRARARTSAEGRRARRPAGANTPGSVGLPAESPP